MRNCRGFGRFIGSLANFGHHSLEIMVWKS
jgi:hypothetical protein